MRKSTEAEHPFIKSVITVINDVFEKVVPGRPGYRILNLQLYREDVVQTLTADDEHQFKEIVIDETKRLEPGRVRLELTFEDKETGRQVKIFAATIISPGGTLVHTDDFEIGSLDTLKGEAGPSGTVVSLHEPA